jgi:hypothetical protein
MPAFTEEEHGMRNGSPIKLDDETYAKCLLLEIAIRASASPNSSGKVFINIRMKDTKYNGGWGCYRDPDIKYFSSPKDAIEHWVKNKAPCV